jgi:prolyl 4-hydroxylase
MQKEYKCMHAREVSLTHWCGVFTCTTVVNVDQQGMDEPWQLEVYGHDGHQATNVTMEVGDMILYESHSVIHGRPFPLQGDLYANVFLHFEPKADTTSFYDPKIGLPPYIIPGSKWESEWRAQHPNGWLGGYQEDRSAREAVIRGDVDKMRELGESGHDSLHKPDSNGWHPLHEAVRDGNIEMVQILLDYGADVNQETKYEQNPLSISLSYHGLGHEMTEFLLDMGALDAGPDL